MLLKPCSYTIRSSIRKSFVRMSKEMATARERWCYSHIGHFLSRSRRWRGCDRVEQRVGKSWGSAFNVDEHKTVTDHWPVKAQRSHSWLHQPLAVEASEWCCVHIRPLLAVRPVVLGCSRAWLEVPKSALVWSQLEQERREAEMRAKREEEERKRQEELRRQQEDILRRQQEEERKRREEEELVRRKQVHLREPDRRACWRRGPSGCLASSHRFTGCAFLGDGLSRGNSRIGIRTLDDSLPFRKNVLLPNSHWRDILQP